MIEKNIGKNYDGLIYAKNGNKGKKIVNPDEMLPSQKQIKMMR